MTVAFALFLLFCLLICALGPLLAWQSAARKRRRAYQQIARRFRGRFVRGGLLRRPRIVLRHGDASGSVAEGPARGPYFGKCTQVSLHWPERRRLCEIFPRSASPEARPHRRLRECPTGDRQFDAQFLVRGRDPEELRDLLTDGVRWQLNRLLHLHDDRRAYVILSRGQLLVQKAAVLRQFEELESLVETALGLFDQLMLSRAEGIEFLVTPSLPTLHGVTCRVCGDQIGDDLVYCRRCKTPHHGECWQYVGQCSIFGCHEKRYLLPRRGAPAGDPPSTN